DRRVSRGGDGSRGAIQVDRVIEDGRVGVGIEVAVAGVGNRDVMVACRQLRGFREGSGPATERGRSKYGAVIQEAYRAGWRAGARRVDGDPGCERHGLAIDDGARRAIDRGRGGSGLGHAEVDLRRITGAEVAVTAIGNRNLVGAHGEGRGAEGRLAV